MLSLNDDDGSIKSEQVSMVVGSTWLITFQEIEGDVFDTIRERIKNGKGRIRRMGVDYLAYSLIDAIVDNYFIIMEKLGEQIEDIEEELLNSPDRKTLGGIHALRKEMLYLHKSVWPLREVVSKLERSESAIILDATRMYFRDVYDHTVQLMDSVETFRDMLSGILETYLSSISNRLNDIMRVLTIFSTIFIPLTFIAGVYGMNFHYMPELTMPWGYPVAWGVMITLALVMLYFFRRKHWL
jgi:magnesium transporter